MAGFEVFGLFFVSCFPKRFVDAKKDATTKMAVWFMHTTLEGGGRRFCYSSTAVLCCPFSEATSRLASDLVVDATGGVEFWFVFGMRVEGCHVPSFGVTRTNGEVGSVVQGTNNTSGSCHGGQNPLLLLLLLRVKGVEGSLHFCRRQVPPQWPCLGSHSLWVQSMAVVRAFEVVVYSTCRVFACWFNSVR